MTEIRFTLSVIRALNCVLKLAHGKLSVWRGSREEDTRELVDIERPAWFTSPEPFFIHRIKASPIRRTERLEPCAKRVGLWKLEREVHFFQYGQLIATVHLVGEKLDGVCLDENPDNRSFWEVDYIEYFQNFDVSNPPTEWRKVQVEDGLFAQRVD